METYLTLRRSAWRTPEELSFCRQSIAAELAALQGLSKRMMGLEPTTFCMASRRSSQLSYIRGARPV